jgi:hypothetical protein
MAKDKQTTQLWRDPNTFATVLLTSFLDTFGNDALYWDPATIALEIEDEFDIELAEITFDKLMMAVTLLTTDKFYTSLPTFISVCNVLSGTPFDPTQFDPADSAEVAWGITEGLLIYPPDTDAESPFSDEIRAYIGATLDGEGIINPPDVLRIALRTANVSTSLGDFSDDPVMFNAIHDMEAAKTGEIESIMDQNLHMLYNQLAQLKLQNGDTTQVLEAIKGAM